MPTQLYTNWYSSTAVTTNSTYTLWQPNLTTASTQYQYIQPVSQKYYKYRPTFGSGTGIYTTGSDTAWTAWVTSPNATWVETPEEAAARRQRRLEQDQEARAARTRARILLHEFLTDEQKAELEKHGVFHVIGSRGRRYCIRTQSQSANVDLLKPDGTVQAVLCAHPREHLPLEDAWLMQMIELRHDEDHFLKTANVHRGSLPVAA